MSKTERELLEKKLVKSFDEVQRYSSKHFDIVKEFKDGTFGVSNLSYALYSNGNNLRGISNDNSSGLIYYNGDTLFSVGFFTKEVGDSNDFYMFIVAPRSKKNKLAKEVKKFVERVRDILKDEIAGVYVRFLTSELYLEFLSEGFLPIKENPWHPESPEEDETFMNSILTIKDLLNYEGDKLEINNIEDTVYSRNSRKKIRDGYNRFSNFLDRNSLSYELVEYNHEKHKSVAKDIINKHFNLLQSQGKNIGSTPEDHYNSFEKKYIEYEDNISYVGYIGNKPVTVFIGERISETRYGLYTTFTLRDKKLVFNKKSIGVLNLTGFTAMPVYAYVMLFIEILKQGFEEVHLGGSELADLNRFKRQLGCKIDTSYWVIYKF